MISRELQASNPEIDHAPITAVNAADRSAEGLEIFDGDGMLPTSAPSGTFHGHPVGCNPNVDGVVNAGDVSCMVVKLFGGACGG